MVTMSALARECIFVLFSLTAHCLVCHAQVLDKDKKLNSEQRQYLMEAAERAVTLLQV